MDTLLILGWFFFFAGLALFSMAWGQPLLDAYTVWKFNRETNRMKRRPVEVARNLPRDWIG